MKRAGFAILTLFVVITALPVSLFAAEPSDWLTGEPQMSGQFDIGTDLVPYSINGNRDCVMQKIITKPKRIISIPPYLQSEQSHESCVVNTGYGAVSQSGYLQTPGSAIFGRVTFHSGGSLSLLPIPRSPNALYLGSNSPNGPSLFLIRDFLSSITSEVDIYGQVTYKLDQFFTSTPIRDSSNRTVRVKIDSISFSASGKWMVADIPFLGLVRVDTASLTMTVFDTPFNYNVGSEPGVHSAITANGRYAVTGSSNHTRLRLYDLDNCPTATSCQYKDLWKYFKDNVPGFTGAYRLRFSTDYSLRLYIAAKPAAAQTTTRLVLTADGHSPASFGYLALGDSFASGEGAYQYKAITDTNQNKCHLSQRSYPYIIADELGINEMESVACSGAVIKDINDKSDDYEGQVKDGIKRVDRDLGDILGSFNPGYIPQEYFLPKYSPEVLTISTVGNDIGFADKIKRCLEPDTCYSTYEDRLEIVRQINGQFDRLVGMYDDIKKEMEGKKVYVIGYPEIAMDDGSCGGNVRLNAGEVKFSNQLVRYLNSIVKAAADKAGFFYVNVEKSFYGHRLCETSGPNEAVNGITAGNDIVNVPFADFGGPIGNESFHPNALGHRRFKETILDKTSGFTAEMPAPNPDAAPPEESDDLEILKDAPKPNRDLYAVNYDDDLGNDVALRGGVWGGTVNTSKTVLESFAPASVWLHSDPVKLAEFTTDASSRLAFEVQIPDTVPVGYHTIHVYGTNMAGEKVDIQKVIYVAASEGDTDGDGIPNEFDNCGFGLASGTDHDQDGTDDACDGSIGNPPETPVNNEQATQTQNTDTLAANTAAPFPYSSPVNSGIVAAEEPQQVAGASTSADIFKPTGGSPGAAAEEKQTGFWLYIVLPSGFIALSMLFYLGKQFKP